MLHINDLTYRIEGRPIFDQATAGIPADHKVGLVGRNGAGKTTLLRTLLGFFPPTAGSAKVLGLSLADEGKEIRALIGYMPENDAYVAGMTAVHFIRMMAELSGLPPEPALERAHETLFYVGLGEARYRKLGTFSTGMKQMVKLAYLDGMSREALAKRFDRPEGTIKTWLHRSLAQLRGCLEQ